MRQHKGVARPGRLGHVLLGESRRNPLTDSVWDMLLLFTSGLIRRWFHPLCSGNKCSYHGHFVRITTIRSHSDGWVTEHSGIWVLFAAQFCYGHCARRLSRFRRGIRTFVQGWLRDYRPRTADGVRMQSFQLEDTCICVCVCVCVCACVCVCIYIYIYIYVKKRNFFPPFAFTSRLAVRGRQSTQTAMNSRAGTVHKRSASLRTALFSEKQNR